MSSMKNGFLSALQRKLPRSLRRIESWLGADAKGIDANRTKTGKNGG